MYIVFTTDWQLMPKVLPRARAKGKMKTYNVLRLLNVVIHEYQFKRKGKYCKFHFEQER